MQNRNQITKKSIKLVVMVLLIMIFWLFNTQIADAAAKDKGYSILNFDTSITVNNNHSYDITKSITVDIPDDFDSLTIKVPLGSYRISDVRVADVDFTVDNVGNDKLITIISSDDLTKGEHTYNIEYKIEEYADHNPASDMFYFDVLPPDWEIPIQNFKMTMTLPDDFVWDDLQYYAGQFGSQDVTNILNYSVVDNTIVMTGSKLPADFGITFKAELPEGYWQDELDNKWASPFGAIMMLTVLVLIFLIWLIFGRNAKLKKTEERTPINGVSPADIGFIFYGAVRIRDLISLVIYLGIKGNIKIVEYRQKRYRLYKVSEPKEEARFVRNVCNTLFDDVYDGRALEMDQIPLKLRRALNNVRMDIESGYASKDMQACTELSKLMRIVSMVIVSLALGVVSVLADMYLYLDLSILIPVSITLLGYVSLQLMAYRFDGRYERTGGQNIIAMLLPSIMYLGVLGYTDYRLWAASKSLAVAITIMVAGIIAAIVICFMKARGKGNANLVSRLLSLRSFIDHSDDREIGEEVAANPDYFYDMYPFAFQFALLDKWAKKFRWMGVESADWYVNEISERDIANMVKGETTIEVARAINTFARTMESEYHASVRNRRLFR